MVGFNRVLDRAAQLKLKKGEIVEATKQLFRSSPPGTFTGQKNTKKDVEDRIRIFQEMLEAVLA